MALKYRYARRTLHKCRRAGDSDVEDKVPALAMGSLITAHRAPDRAEEDHQRVTTGHRMDGTSL